MIQNLYKNRIERLRREMRREGMDLYLIPMSDDHGSEYIAGHFKQIAYYSGFTGSAGTLLITYKQVLLWTDGRYFLQAKEELEKCGGTLMKMGEKEVPTVWSYIAAYPKEHGDQLASADLKLGFDGRLLRFSSVRTLQTIWEKEGNRGALLLCPAEDIAGELWQQDEEEKRPVLAQKGIWRLEETYSGKPAAEKIEEVRLKLEQQGQELLLLSALDEIAWLLNLRGDDIAYNPVFYSYLTVTRQQIVLYVMEVSDEIKGYLRAIGVEIRAYGEIYDDLKKQKGKKIWADERSANYLLLAESENENEIKLASTPVYFQKAVKNETEIENMKKAHLADGIAVTRFLYWLKTEVCAGKQRLTELGAAEKLETFRRQEPQYIGPSFAPIMAYGQHGAIVHYEADEASDMPIERENFLLCDTGGHYLTGTTDITRTVAMGPLTEEQKRHYTAVLMGNLRLAAAKWKRGLQGCHLDLTARQPLYELGLDFNHGTGHGVGYLLNVHEGPNAFRTKPDEENVILPGMITSDEPGVYLEGCYGIRLENLILCVTEMKSEYGDILGFEPLTLVPFDREAIDAEMLTETDKELLDAYHRQVWEKVSPYLNAGEKEWLREQTAPVSFAPTPDRLQKSKYGGV